MPPSKSRSLSALENVRRLGRRIEFGKTASDFARFRAGFPDELFARLTALGVVVPGRTALDLGTGTGTLARGLAIRGMVVTGLDKSREMMEQAKALDAAVGVSVRYVAGEAEVTGLEPSSFDLVAAGQSWHWFDRARAASEARRILKPHGHIVIAHFDWIPLPGNVVEATERLIEDHNPEWHMGGGHGIHAYELRDLAVAGFEQLETLSFDTMVSYTHEAWRGRIRASAGVGASMTPDRVERFDADLARLLAKRFPADPIGVHHRAFAAIGSAP
jgi:SAM-dependent methyltransferase